MLISQIRLLHYVLKNHLQDLLVNNNPFKPTILHQSLRSYLIAGQRGTIFSFGTSSFLVKMETKMTIYKTIKTVQLQIIFC